MISSQLLNKAKDLLVATYHPVEIYLFGSYAWGNLDKESDLDFLIIVDTIEGDHYKALVAGYLALADYPVPKDLLLITQSDFLNKSEHRSTLYYKIKHNGKKIYGRA